MVLLKNGIILFERGFIDLMHLGLKIIQRIIISLFPFDPFKNGRSSSPVGRLDFKSRWGRQRSLAGSTPVIFRHFLFYHFPIKPLINAFSERKIAQNTTIRKFRIVRLEGNWLSCNILNYNLSMTAKCNEVLVVVVRKLQITDGS